MKRIMDVRARIISLMSACLVALICILPTTAVAAETHYRVKPGDSLWSIAKQYDTTVLQLKTNNDLMMTNTIQVHQLLYLPNVRQNAKQASKTRSKTSQANKVKPSVHHPKSVFHVVRSGDSLWRIANAYNTSIENLKARNGLSSDVIYPGQKLRVYPGKHSGDVSLQQVVIARRVGMPTRLISVYQTAGSMYGVPWQVLAAIHHVETRFSTQRCVSPNGAQGPMQFMPSTFARYGVTAPGRHGPPDINNVDDAIYSAAHMLQADGYQKSPTMALYLYNHSMIYVETVQRFADSI